MLIVKIHDSPNGKVVAVCDKDILGKKFEDEKLQLDLSGEFYAGDEMVPEAVVEMIKSAYQANLAGEEAVKLAVDAGLVEEEHIIQVQGVPHAIIVMDAE